MGHHSPLNPRPTTNGKLCRASSKGRFLIIECLSHAIILTPNYYAPFCGRRLRDPEAHDIPDEVVEAWEAAVKTNTKVFSHMRMKSNACYNAPSIINQNHLCLM